MNSSKPGYGSPPQHSQFKPGNSGNKKGRPKGRISIARLIEKHLNTMIVVTIAGQQKKVTRREALVLSLVGDALKGKDKVRKQLLDMMLLFDAQFHADSQGKPDIAVDHSVLQSLLYSYGLNAGPGDSSKSGGDPLPAGTTNKNNQPLKAWKKS